MLQAVGRFPLPPYWSLGFQLCKFGYDTIGNLKEVVDRMLASEIPYVS
jgi:alpha-glucosidase (family GH31 glycosyl hydrolase)